MTDVMLVSSRGTLVFGQTPFVLHRLDPGTPALCGTAVGQRTAEIVGYILPAGETEADRAAEMEKARRLLCRIVGDPEGFALRVGDREIPLTAQSAPQFSAEAPLTGTDAALFTVRGVSRGEDGCFAGEPVCFSVPGQSGMLTFPLAVTERTVFGSQAQSGRFTAVNPGDGAAGFTLTAVAEGGGIDSFTLSLGEDFLTVRHPLAEGQSLCIDTRPGQKDVTAAGASVLPETDWRSTFFALLPGENSLCWSCTGTGHPVLTFALTPRYLTGGGYGYSDF